MNKEQIFDALSFIDDSMLEQTNKLRMAPRRKKITSIKWVRYATVAAAAVLILVVGSTSLGKFTRKSIKDDAVDRSFAAMEACSEAEPEYSEVLDMKTFSPLDKVTDKSETFDNTINMENSWQQNADAEIGLGVREDGTAEEGAFANDYVSLTAGFGNTNNVSSNVITDQQNITYTVSSANCDSVIFLCSNNYDHAVYTGNDYELEACIDDVWYTCEPGTEIADDGILWTFEGKSNRVFNFSINNAYGTLLGGKYRIVKKFYLSAPDQNEKAEEILTAFEFNLE